MTFTALAHCTLYNEDREMTPWDSVRLNICKIHSKHSIYISYYLFFILGFLKRFYSLDRESEHRGKGSSKLPFETWGSIPGL